MSAEYTKGIRGDVSRIHKRGKGRVSAEYTKGVKGGCQQNTQKG